MKEQDSRETRNQSIIEDLKPSDADKIKGGPRGGDGGGDIIVFDIVDSCP